MAYDMDIDAEGNAYVVGATGSLVTRPRRTEMTASWTVPSMAI